MKTLRIIVAATVIAVPALAKAPGDQYDGFDRNSVVIHDLQTRLIWEREVRFELATYDQAAADCSARYGGRLPTVKELLTLIDEEPQLEHLGGTGTVVKLIDLNAFPGILDNRAFGSPIDAPYWSSTPTSSDPAGPVWTLSFDERAAMAPAQRTEALGAKLHYRCVKDAKA